MGIKYNIFAKDIMLVSVIECYQGAEHFLMGSQGDIVFLQQSGNPIVFIT